MLEIDVPGFVSMLEMGFCAIRKFFSCSKMLIISIKFFFPFRRIIRSTQSFIFPIHLSEDIVPAAIFYASVTPLLVWLFVRKSIIEPMNESEKQKNIDKSKETNKQRLCM